MPCLYFWSGQIHSPGSPFRPDPIFETGFFLLILLCLTVFNWENIHSYKSNNYMNYTAFSVKGRYYYELREIRPLMALHFWKESH